MGEFDECKSVLSSIQTTVNGLNTQLNKLTETINDIGEMIQDTQEYLQDDIKKFLEEESTKNSDKLAELANLIIKTNKNVKVVLDSMDKQTTFLGNGIKKIADIEIENNKYLSENRELNSVLPDSVLQSIANCEAILRSVNRVYLGGS